MLVCKCAEIELYQGDLEILVDSKGELNNLSEKVLRISGCTQKMASESPEAYETDNISEICDALKNVNKDIEPSITAWVGKIDEDIAYVEGILETLKKEDEEFHKNEKLHSGGM